MALLDSKPDDRTLREYLLGSLAPERAEPVTAWLATEPIAADTLHRFAAGDALTAALADISTVEATSAVLVERVIRSVLEELGADDTRYRPVPATRQLEPATTAVRNAPEAPTLTRPLPVQLGGYRVVREIGRGGMGIVLEAEDVQLQRRVAVKVMAQAHATDPSARARFLREARAAAAIEHENVVPIHQVGEHDGVPFIVMPLLRGEALESCLKRQGRLSLAEVIRLGREVASGLAAAHKRGLIHRDIKPANIWLAGEGGKAIILDFGLVRATDGSDALTAPGAMPGTPAYMAPEQVDGLPVDARTDLFSLGATLYRCATGEPAFAGPTLSAILRAVTAHNPPSPRQVNPAIPGPLSDLIVRLLAKDPAERPQSALQVVNEIASLGEPPTLFDLRQTDPTRPTGPRRQRSRWVDVVLGVAVLAALASAGAWFVKHPPWQTAAPGTPPQDPPTPVHYHGKVDVLVEREDWDGRPRLLRLNKAGALPLRKTDKFRIEVQVDPPAYLYVVWVDPGHDVTPVYPWNVKEGWGSRPAQEERVERVSQPRNAGKLYTARDAKPGVATMVVFARPTPLDVPDDEVRKWFESLPDLPLPTGGEEAAVWFDDYVEVRDPDRPRTFGEVGADDAFAQWQGQLQMVLKEKAAFQTAVSFARTGRK